ncbi:hypothetical protein C8F01DRAFT_1242839 [Mycena amicta]|nr:hypothetical protein C8F01DRAFT_1242839 [Mycena amicta]
MIHSANRQAYDQLMGAARFIPRGADAYWNLPRILLYGCAELFGDLANHRSHPDSGRHASVFHLIIATTTFDLKPVLRYLYLNSHGKTRTAWKDLVTAMSDAATNARTNDTNKFKSATHMFLPAPDSTFKPSLIGIGKASRGLAHPQLRLLIMPWVDRNFPSVDDSAPPLALEAQAILDKIASKSYSPSNGKFPSCFYPDGGWVADDYQENLFRMELFPRALRLLFLGPSNTLNKPGDTATKFETGCNAAIHNTWTVAPRMVAYVAVQLRTSISDLSQWSEKEGKYSFKNLYEKVLRAFDDNSAPGRENWSQETLKWLTEYTSSPPSPFLMSDTLLRRTFGDLQCASRQRGDQEEGDSDDEADVQLMVCLPNMLARSNHRVFQICIPTLFSKLVRFVILYFLLVIASTLQITPHRRNFSSHILRARIRFILNSPRIGNASDTPSS